MWPCCRAIYRMIRRSNSHFGLLQYHLPRSRHSVRDQSVRNSPSVSAPRECCVRMRVSSALFHTAPVCHVDKPVDRKQVNFVRSLIGTIVLFGVVIGASWVPRDQDHHALENGGHTGCCLAHTPPLAAITFALGMSTSLSSIAGMYLSLLVGSNFRALTYVGRAIVVLFLQVCSHDGI